MKRLGRVNPTIKRNARDLRRSMTDAERLLWRYLRQRKVAGRKFRRQHPVVNYVVDFACLEAGLIVEVDGGQHADRQDHDTARTAWLERQGFRVLRFWNSEVLANVEGFREVIWREVLSSSRPPP